MNKLNLRRNNVKFDIFINWRLKHCMRSQKYKRIKLYYLDFFFDISIIN